jgi:hypothetical protein
MPVTLVEPAAQVLASSVAVSIVHAPEDSVRLYPRGSSRPPPGSIEHMQKISVRRTMFPHAGNDEPSDESCQHIR